MAATTDQPQQFYQYDPALPTAEDFASFSDVEPLAASVPAQQAPPIPPKQSTGITFNFDAFRAKAEQVGYAGLSAPEQRLIDQMASGIIGSPETMAQFLIDEENRLRQQNSPQAQAELQKSQAQIELTNQNLQKAKTESSAASAQKLQDAQKTYQTASNMVWLLDNLRGGPRDKVTAGNEKWRSRVGSIDGRWPSLLSSEETLGWNADFNSLKGMINLSEAKENRGQGSLTDSERVLMAQAASLGLEQARDEKGFNAAFERMYDLALTAQERERKKLLGEPAASQGTSQHAPPPAPLPQFQSREQVMQAVNAGQITREQGVQALRTQFGNQFR